VETIILGPTEFQKCCIYSSLEALIGSDVPIKMALYQIESVGADVLISMSRQSADGLFDFQAMARSFKVHDWNLFIIN